MLGVDLRHLDHGSVIRFLTFENVSCSAMRSSKFFFCFATCPIRYVTNDNNQSLILFNLSLHPEWNHQFNSAPIPPVVVGTKGTGIKGHVPRVFGLFHPRPIYSIPDSKMY